MRMIRQILVVLLVGLTGADPARADDDRIHPGIEVRADLDGDGLIESIRLDTRGNEEWKGLFRLQVSSTALDDSLFDRIDWMQLVDVDTTDRFREIAVVTEGPSDDYQMLLYRWDAGRFHRLCRINDIPEFPGDGQMVASFLCGFWFRSESYAFEEAQGLFRWNSRTRYPVSAWSSDEAEIRAGAPLELVSTPGDTTIIATIEIGDAVEFISWQPPLPPHEEARISGESGWYEVRGKSGPSGWIPGPDVRDIRGLLYPD